MTANFKDTDSLLVDRGQTNYKATYSDLKDSLERDGIGDGGGGGGGETTITKPIITAPPNGAGIGGDVTYTPRTSTVSSVSTIDITDAYENWVRVPSSSWIAAGSSAANMFDGDANTYLLIDSSAAGAGSTIQFYVKNNTGYPDLPGFNTGDTVKVVTKYIGGNDASVEFFYTDGSSDLEITETRNSTLTKDLKTITVRDNNGGSEDFGWVSVSLNGAELIGDAVLDQNTTLTLTDSKTYNNDDGADTGASISETFSAGQTVTAESTTVFADTPAFSTTLYAGDNTSSRSIPTGIDNTSKSLVWVKKTDGADNHNLTDTLRGNTQVLETNFGRAASTYTTGVTSFNNNGVTLGNDGGYNASGSNYAAWNFRAAPTFFDIQTWTGDGLNPRKIPHDLTTVPNCIIVKCTDSRDWVVYHRRLNGGSNPWEYGIVLNSALAQVQQSWFANTEPTDKDFTVEASSNVNGSGREYVAYLFAETPGLIKCGNYTGTSSNQTINCGFEPQFALIKNTSGSADWELIDNQRPGKRLRPNGDNSENASDATLNASGIALVSNGPATNESGQTYIYVAIAKNAAAAPGAGTGTVASAIDNILTLTDVGGTWSAGDFAVNDEEATMTGPGADVLEFVGSTPQDVPVNSVSEWGNATWQVSTDENFTSPMVGTKLITNAAIPQTLGKDDRGAIILASDTQYWARLRYAATEPSRNSAYSSTVTFKTAAAEVPVIDDVFSTTLYAGDGTRPRNIPTGIDNSVKSLVWVKERTTSSGTGNSHNLVDSLRGNGMFLNSDEAYAEQNAALVGVQLKPFGFDIGTPGSGGDSRINDPNNTYVAWNFRAAPKFMDIQTYTGTAVRGLSVPHQLTTAPAMMIIKNIDAADNWMVYHKELGAEKALNLNQTGPALGPSNAYWAAEPTTTEFSLATSNLVNASGEEFVAYLFADTPGMIKCGSYTGNGATQTIDCGFEPQWVIIKMSNDSRDWSVIDSARGNRVRVRPNDSAIESNTNVDFVGNGFYLSDQSTETNRDGSEYIYMAIAKGTPTTFFDPEAFQALNEHQVERRFGIDPNKVNTNKLPVNRLTTEPKGVTSTFVQEGDKYRPIEDQTGTVNRLNAEVTAAQQKVEDLETRLLSRIKALENGTNTTDQPT